MGFLSGIVHAIGNGLGDVEDFFGGNNKKKQNQPAQPQPQRQPLNILQNDQSDANFQANNPQIQQNNNQPAVQQQLPYEANLIRLNNQQNQPDPSTLQKAPVAGPKPSLLSQAANMVAGPFRPIGEGIARLLPGGQNDIKANDNTIQQNNQALSTYAALHKAGKMSDAAYYNALSSVNQSAVAGSNEATRIGKTTYTPLQVAASAAAIASAPLLGGVGLGGSLLSKAGTGALVGTGAGVDNELATNAKPTIKGTLEQGAIGGLTGGAIPLAGPLLRKVAPEIIDAAGNAINTVKPGVKAAVDGVGSLLTKAKNVTGDVLDKAGNIANKVGSTIENAGTKVDNVLDRLLPNEVSPGVKSINPNGQADVAAHIAANHPDVAAPVAPVPVETAPVPQGPQVSAEHPDAPKIVQDAQPKPEPVSKAAPVVAPEPREVPNYMGPVKNGKASVGGSGSATYTTGDPNLDRIVHDSIIAHKGTAGTAGARGDALDQAGVSQTDRATIRDIAVHNVDKETGKISSAGVKKINGVLTAPREAGRIRPDGSKIMPNGDVFDSNGSFVSNQGHSLGEPTSSAQVDPTIPQTLTEAPPQAPAAPATPAPVTEKAAPGTAPAPASLKSPTGRTAPNAPDYVAGLEKDLRTAEKNIPKSANEHEILSNEELSAAGKAVTDQMSDQQLLDKFGTGVKFNSHGEAAVGNSALDRLGKIYEAKGVDPVVKSKTMDAIKNIIDAAGEQQSSAGRVLNYGQEMVSHLPRPAKVAYYIRHIDDINLKAGADEASLLKENPEQAAVVEKKLDDFIAKDDANKSEIAKHSEVGQKGADAATRGEVTTKELKEAFYAKQSLENERRQNAGNFSDYYQTLVPDSKSVGQKLGDWQRTAMLSSPSGRLNALGGTGLNVVDKGLKQGVSGLLGKAYNAIRGTGNGLGVADTGSDASSLGKGFVAGLKKSAAIVKGQNYVENPDAVMGATGARNTLSDLPNSGGNVATRAVRAAVSGHQNLSVGVKDSELLRMSRTAGIQEGLTGDDLEKYTWSHATNPDGMTAVKAQEAHDTINNLNKNPITDALTAVGNGLAKIPKVGPLIKNQVVPFSHFVGGNVWNTLTDRNLVAAAAKTVIAATKGDAQGVIDGLGSTAVEGGKAYGMGWLLTQHGILTNKDAKGDSYEGTYLHFGNRYIPVTSLGSFAPSIILGNAAYNGFHDPKGNGSVISSVAKSAGNAITGAYKAYSGEQILGGATTLSGPFNQAFGKKGNSGNSLAPLTKVATNVGGQFIPAATSDVNAVLNNSPLNPTHEAADTKVLNADSKTGKAADPVKSAGAGLLNKLPLFSQRLPRQTGVASQDLLDKITKGDNASPAQQKAAAVTLSKAQLVADFAKNPNKIVDPQNTSADVLKQVDSANKKSFEASGLQKQTLNGTVYEKDVNGKTKSSSQVDNAFATSQGGVDSVQRAKDTEAFKASGKQLQTINGTVYERGDDGKVAATEQKDYDYKNTDEGMTTAKAAGDYTGYQTHSTNLLKNISDQLQNPNLSSKQVDALTNKAMAVQKQSSEYDAYGGFSKPKGAETFKGVGQINGARQYTPDEQKQYGTTSTGFVQEIQRNAAKYNLDPQALLAVSSMEGLGGGVGDGGHAFGPFQMNDAGGVLTGKFKSANEARAYAESPKGIEDAVKQISAVASNLKGKAAIDAIVRNFERPANPDNEVAGANEIYDGGSANLSNSGSGAAVTQDAEKGSAGASAAAKLIKDNTITNLPQLQKVLLGQLTPKQIASVPILQKILPADLVKQRTISVAKTRA